MPKTATIVTLAVAVVALTFVLTGMGGLTVYAFVLTLPAAAQ